MHILHKMQELEKIKLILLNNDQVALFNLIAKPLISNEDKKFDKSPGIEMSQMISVKDRKENINDIFNRYRQKNEKELSEVDKRLLNLIDLPFK